MNIGIVTVWADCGAGYVSKAYETVLAQQHKVFIYSRGSYASGRGDPYWDAPNVTWDPFVGGITQVDWNAYERWLVENKIDLVLFNEQRYWQVVLRTRQTGVLTAAYVDYYTAQTVELFGLYDVLICNTRRHYSVFESHPQVWFVPWGTDCTLFQPGQRWGKEQETVIFFHSAGMGGPNDRKGTGATLQAFQEVKGSAQLVVHSQLSLAQLPGAWQTWIAADPRIRLIEGTTKPPGYYNLGDVYVYPSRLEGIGLTILEALASGLPVITTDNAPMNEFITQNKTGLLLPVDKYIARYDGYYWPEAPCRPPDLTVAMQTYVNDRAMLLRHQQNAHQNAQSNRSWTDTAKALLPLLESVSRLKLDPDEEARFARLVYLLDAQNEPTATILAKRALKLAFLQLSGRFAKYSRILK